MFVNHEGQHLYLKHWDYNSLRIMTELARIVHEHGGRAIPAPTITITNRSITGLLNDYKLSIKKIKSSNTRFGASQVRSNALRSFRRKIADLQEIDNSPIEVRGSQSIRFVIRDSLYYYSFDSNPFFDFYYYKVPVNENGEYSVGVQCSVDEKCWLSDQYITSMCSDSDIRGAASYIFNMLVRSQYSSFECQPGKLSRKGKVDF